MVKVGRRVHYVERVEGSKSAYLRQLSAPGCPMSEAGLCQHTYSEDLLHTTVSAAEILPLIRLSFISHLFLSDFDFDALYCFISELISISCLLLGFGCAAGSLFILKLIFLANLSIWTSLIINHHVAS